MQITLCDGAFDIHTQSRKVLWFLGPCAGKACLGTADFDNALLENSHADGLVALCVQDLHIDADEHVKDVNCNDFDVTTGTLRRWRFEACIVNSGDFTCCSIAEVELTKTLRTNNSARLHGHA